MTNPSPGSALACVPLEVVQSTASTNSDLMTRPWPQLSCTSAASLLALEQTAGRGRRGKTWLADGEASLCLSIGRDWHDVSGAAMRHLPGLSLAVGVVVTELLEARFAAQLPVLSLRLKWPNDIVRFDVGAKAPGKLGGILIEVRQQANMLRAVVGLGLNLGPPDSSKILLAENALAASQLFEHGALPDRYLLAQQLAQVMHDAVLHCLQFGWHAYKNRFEARDVLIGKQVNLPGQACGPSTSDGVVVGLAEDAALLVRCAGQDQPLLSVHAGEVSVRAQHWGARQ